MRGWVTGLLAAYAVSYGMVRWSGIDPVLPWRMLLWVALVCLPFTIVFAAYERSAGSRRGLGVEWVVAGVSLAVFHYFLLWPVLAIALMLWPRTRLPLGNVKRVLAAGAILSLGYATIWHVNYLLARHASAERWDPVLRHWDLAAYGAVLGGPLDYAGLFPLVSEPLLLRMLDNAYALLIPEVLLVAVLMAREADATALPRFFTRLFGLYAGGVATFLVFPAIGPCLYFPDSVDIARSLPGAATLIQGMLNDYRAASNGGTITGFGYFIAVPSLHVLASLYLQSCLRPYPRLFRAFLPMNAALIASTFLLGYHYLFDIAAGALAFALYLAADRFWSQRSKNACQAGSMAGPLALCPSLVDANSSRSSTPSSR